jgi:hypothetical protein
MYAPSPKRSRPQAVVWATQDSRAVGCPVPQLVRLHFGRPKEWSWLRTKQGRVREQALGLRRAGVPRLAAVLKARIRPMA